MTEELLNTQILDDDSKDEGIEDESEKVDGEEEKTDDAMTNIMDGDEGDEGDEEKKPDEE